MWPPAVATRRRWPLLPALCYPRSAMRRTSPTPSHLRDAIATTRQRIAAALGLLALGLLLGHVHPAHESEIGRFEGPVVSDDHAHASHSSRIVLDSAPCLGCRSFDEEALTAARGTLSISVDLLKRALPERSDSATRAPFAGLPATRAPPIG